MKVHSGVKPRARGRIRRSRLPHSLLPAIPRDYIERRRLFRNLSNLLMIVFLSIFIAGVIVYTSDPSSFSFLRH